MKFNGKLPNEAGHHATARLPRARAEVSSAVTVTATATSAAARVVKERIEGCGKLGDAHDSLVKNRALKEGFSGRRKRNTLKHG